jgi:HEAT repeat protein
MRDRKAAKPLAEILVKFRNTYTLSAVALALAAIGTDDALNALATALMQGEENLRRAAAEAFANHPAEGWETLKEALGIDDILVRRSALHGLARIQQPWAEELILHTQLEDKEWAVRDIAAGILEKSKPPNLHIPRKLPPPSESPWLIAFAGKEGMGISPGAPATDVLLLALKSEDIDEKLAALAYLRRTPSDGVINALYHKMYGDNIEMREAVFLALVEIAASGVTLPEPQSYGLA